MIHQAWPLFNSAHPHPCPSLPRGQVYTYLTRSQATVLVKAVHSVRSESRRWGIQLVVGSAPKLTSFPSITPQGSGSCHLCASSAGTTINPASVFTAHLKMALSYHNFSKWDMDQVSQWLGQIHLTSLIPNFERLGITGNDLMQMDEAFMKETLRISKPLEIVALRGAIMSLIDSAQAPQVPQWKAGRPQSMATNNLERSSSFETPVQNRSLSHPTTLPRNYTMGSAVNGRKELTFRPPQLLSNASAPTLLDDNCRYSGWIRKQGGGYKNCEYHADV